MKKIVVLGDIMIDETWYGRVDKISPEAPVPVLQLEGKTTKLGGAANVANNLRALSPDTEVYLAGFLGLSYRQMLADREIKLFPQGWTSSEETNVKLRIVDSRKGYHITRVDNEELARCKSKSLPADSISSWLKEVKPDAIILSDYVKGSIGRKTVSAIQKSIDCPIHVDTRRKDIRCFEGVDSITPNIREFTSISEFMNERGIEITGPNDLLRQMSLKLGILLTRGHDGMDLYATKVGREQPLHMDPINKNIIDVTGAGDTALAAFVLINTVYPEAGVVASLQVANAAAGNVCMLRGTSVPTRTVKEFLEDYGYYEEKEDSRDHSN